MVQVSASFTAQGQMSDLFTIHPTDSFTYLADFDSDPAVGTVELRSTTDGGATSRVELVMNSYTYSEYTADRARYPSVVQFFFVCTEYTSGTISVQFVDLPSTLKEFKNSAGDVIVSITDNGMIVNGSLTNTADNNDAGVGANGVLTSTEFVVSEQSPSGSYSVLNSSGLNCDVINCSAQAHIDFVRPIYLPHGGASIPVNGPALLFSSEEARSNSAYNGLGFRNYSTTVSLVGASATSVNLPNITFPAGCVILAAQANIASTVTAGGTSVKVALGISSGDVDKYGKTASLAKNQKIDTIPDWAVLAATETISINAVVTDGSGLGDTGFTDGSVRVFITYLQAVSLPNA